MELIDWIIVGAFLVFIIWLSLFTMRYVRSVTDYLACGRICGRYVLCAEDMANGLALVTLIGYVEASYMTGYLVGFWASFRKYSGPRANALARLSDSVRKVRVNTEVQPCRTLERRGKPDPWTNALTQQLFHIVFDLGLIVFVLKRAGIVIGTMP